MRCASFPRGSGVRYISLQPPSKFGLLARSLPGSLPGRLLSHTTLRSRSKLKKNQTTVRSHTPNTNHSQIFSPHGPTTPSPHGPFRPSPAHSDAMVADWSDRTKAEYAFIRSYQCKWQAQILFYELHRQVSALDPGIDPVGWRSIRSHTCRRAGVHSSLYKAVMGKSAASTWYPPALAPGHFINTIVSFAVVQSPVHTHIKYTEHTLHVVSSR